MTLHEWKIGRLVAESRRAVVAKQLRIFAEQHQIEIVVVIVVDPDRLLEPSLRQLRLGLSETCPCLLTYSAAPGFGDDAQIRQPVIVEVAGGDRTRRPSALRGHFRQRDRVPFLSSATPPADQASTSGFPSPSKSSASIPAPFGSSFARDCHVAKFQLGRGLIRGLGLDGLVDLRKEAPLQVFRDRRALGALLDFLKGLQFARRVIGAASAAIRVVKLKMRSGQVGIELRGEISNSLSALRALSVQLVETPRL